MRDYLGIAAILFVIFGTIFGILGFDMMQETSRHNACVEAGGQYITERSDYRCELP